MSVLPCASEIERGVSLTLAGNARAIAGPNPFHSAVTPSAAINLRPQSKKPEYVPDGADWRRDLIVCDPGSAIRAYVFDLKQEQSVNSHQGGWRRTTWRRRPYRQLA